MISAAHLQHRAVKVITHLICSGDSALMGPLLQVTPPPDDSPHVGDSRSAATICNAFNPIFLSNSFIITWDLGAESRSC